LDYFVVFCFYKLLLGSENKRYRLAPIASPVRYRSSVEKILMARGSGHKIVAESGTTRVVRKEVVLLEKKITVAANDSSAKHQRHYP
jgi:hypothetical protein